MTHAPVEAAKNTKSAAVNKGPFTVPGFLAAAAASGMRYRNRHDLALIVAEAGPNMAATGVFTRNRFTAAPVEICKEHLKSRGIRAILVNAGIANACTGEEGLGRARETAKLAASSLRIAPEAVLVASTGVIGMQLNVQAVENAMPGLVGALRAGGWEDAAHAIMTTDTVPKMASVSGVRIGGKVITIGGIAKGSGMIAPNMATLLAFVCTDAAIDQGLLDRLVRKYADETFNCITVDGDTSTNDSLLVLANGRAGNPRISDIESPECAAFGEALKAVLLDLAKRLVVDGEGATKLIEIQVAGAHDEASAKAIAFTVANSPLVKTAFFGEDANWGRIVCAAGRAGVAFDPERVSLHFGDVCVFRDGAPIGGAALEEAASMAFKQKEILVRLDLCAGNSGFTAYTCDLSYDYVKINASYRS
jgi:glutamate N-acetyltransferase/amino-acid N-acetyltransferase